MKTKSIAIWSAVAIVGAVAWGVIALVRDESISAAWLILAAVGSYAIAYRFYARFIQYKVLGADRDRATPAERLENDRDYQPTDRRVLFGHHFAAIVAILARAPMLLVMLIAAAATAGVRALG